MELIYYRHQTVAKIYHKKRMAASNYDYSSDTHKFSIKETNEIIEVMDIQPAFVQLTYYGFEKDIRQGDTISVAVNQGNVVAFVNHSNKKSGCWDGSWSLGDWWTYLFFAAFPFCICGGLFYKIYTQQGLTTSALVTGTLAILLPALIFIGLKRGSNTSKALEILKK